VRGNSRFQIFDFRFLVSNLKSEVFDFKSEIISSTFLVLALIAGSPAGAATPPPSTDDQLRDSLNSKAGDDDYDRELLGDAAKPADGGRIDDKTQKELRKELGPAAQREDKPKPPLLQVAEVMRGVQPRLGRRDAGEETQSMQRQIVAVLQELIEQAKQSGNGGRSSIGRPPAGNGQKKPGPPSGDASARAQTSDPKPQRTPGEIRDEEAKKAVARMLGMFAELRERDRVHVLESPSEHFLPEYELEIEDYFRRLSDDHPELVKP